MFGIIMSLLAVIVGTALGCLLKGKLKQRYQDVLFMAMGLAALGIGLENVVNNLPRSHYPALFIVSLAIGAVVGDYWQIDERFNRLIKHFGGRSQIAEGIATGVLIYCIGVLAIVGPVMAAVKGDNTMLMTNAMLDFVSAMVLGASFGWGMLACAPILFCWQSAIYLVAKYFSATFFTGPLVTEIAIIGGFLITTTGISLLKMRDIKTLNFLPALLVPIVFFIGLAIF